MENSENRRPPSIAEAALAAAAARAGGGAPVGNTTGAEVKAAAAAKTFDPAHWQVGENDLYPLARHGPTCRPKHWRKGIRAPPATPRDPPEKPPTETPRGRCLTKIFRDYDANHDDRIDEVEGVALGRLLCGGDGKAGKAFWDELRAHGEEEGLNVAKNGVSLEAYVKYGRRRWRGPSSVPTLEEAFERMEEEKARQMVQSHRHPILEAPPPGLGPKERAERIFRFLAGPSATTSAADTDADEEVCLQLTGLRALEGSTDPADAAVLDTVPGLRTLLAAEAFVEADGMLSMDTWLGLADEVDCLRDDKFGRALSSLLHKLGISAQALASKAAKESAMAPIDPGLGPKEARATLLFRELSRPEAPAADAPPDDAPAAEGGGGAAEAAAEGEAGGAGGPRMVVDVSEYTSGGADALVAGALAKQEEDAAWMDLDAWRRHAEAPPDADGADGGSGGGGGGGWSGSVLGEAAFVGTLARMYADESDEALEWACRNMGRHRQQLSHLRSMAMRRQRAEAVFASLDLHSEGSVTSEQVHFLREAAEDEGDRAAAGLLRHIEDTAAAAADSRMERETFADGFVEHTRIDEMPDPEVVRMAEAMLELLSVPRDWRMRSERAFAVFEYMDKDSNGTLTHDEVSLRFGSEQYSYPFIRPLLELTAQVYSGPYASDGVLTPEEWRVGTLEATRKKNDDEYTQMMKGIAGNLRSIANRKDMAMRGLKAEAVFAALDEDGNGYVTRAEIDVLKTTDVYEAVCELFAAADESGVAGSVAGDDQLTHEEWMKGIIFHTHYKTDKEFVELFDGIMEKLKSA